MEPRCASSFPPTPPTKCPRNNRIPASTAATLLGSSVAFAGHNNSGTVNGTRSNQIHYTINGTGNSEAGRFLGGNLNVTTKSGSKKIHGDAYY